MEFNCKCVYVTDRVCIRILLIDITVTMLPNDFFDDKRLVRWWA